MKARRSVVDIVKMKGVEPVVCLTAYDYVTAGLLDQAGCDLILVGDSLGNVVLGYDTTLPVTVADVLRHSQAVARGSQHACLVADMPFLSYQGSRGEAVQNAGLFLKEGGMQAVKLEGGRRHAELIEYLVNIGIPVMGHIGMTPQSVNSTGGYKRWGKKPAEVDELLADAEAVARAGAFAIVLECVEPEAAAQITHNIKIPTIGIGSGEACDGQVLVINDLLGYGLKAPPSFVKPAAQLAELVRSTVTDYVGHIKKTAKGKP